MTGNDVPDQRKILEEYITDYETITTDKLNFQFLDIRKDQMELRENEEYSCSVGQRSQNFLRNRYRDILPYNTNRVQLESTESNPDGYINASLITSDETPTVYIASQAPLPETVDDFWHMICQKKINVIVMLCKCVESFAPKCEMYWPKNEGETRTFGDFAVTFVKEVTFNEFSHRSLVVKSEKYGTLETEQLHYTEWPDHGCPQGEQQVLQLIEQMCTLRTDSPILIHCSAGCGRTGTVIALTIIRDLINQKTLKNLNVKDLVSCLRRQRTSMVQTQSQYHLLRKCVAVYCKMALGIDTETKSPASSPSIPEDKPMAPGLSLHTEVLRKPPALPIKPPTQPPLPVEKKSSKPSSPAPPSILPTPANTNPFLEPEPPRSNTNPFLDDVASDNSELVVRL